MFKLTGEWALSLNNVSVKWNYARPDGGSGSMQHEFKVYGRDGEPCDRCGTPIAKTRVAGRGTWFCPVCQGSAPQAASSSSNRPSRSRRHSSV